MDDKITMRVRMNPEKALRELSILRDCARAQAAAYAKLSEMFATHLVDLQEFMDKMEQAWDAERAEDEKGKPDAHD
jgi:hypothetical protein